MKEKTEPRMSGAIVLEIIRAYEKSVGKRVFRAALHSQPEQTRQAFEKLKRDLWIPMRMVDELHRAVAERAGRDSYELQAEAVREGLGRIISKLWRPLFRLTTDSAIVMRTPLFFTQSYDCGELSAEVVQPGRAEVTLSEFPEISDLQINGLAVGIETVLKLAGRKNVRVDRERGADGAFFLVTWQQ